MPWILERVCIPLYLHPAQLTIPCPPYPRFPSRDPMDGIAGRASSFGSVGEGLGISMRRPQYSTKTCGFPGT